jgi:hypothetical protein
MSTRFFRHQHTKSRAELRGLPRYVSDLIELRMVISAVCDFGPIFEVWEAVFA